MQDGKAKETSERAAHFDREDWLKRLRALNPWADGLDIDAESEEFRSARRAASLERWQAGQEAWNSWAEAMLALDIEAKDEVILLTLGAADFASHLFIATADFSGFRFPGQASYGGATFSGEAWFVGAEFASEAWFYKAVFREEVRFDHAVFAGEARFDGSKFFNAARFGGASFVGRAWFDFATFTGSAWFDATTFESVAFFGQAKFLDQARFEGTTFLSMACLSSTTFKGFTSFSFARFLNDLHGNSADFNQATFNGPVTFARAEFHRAAVFTSIHSKVAFSLAGATFARTPDFIEAAFHHPPRLDDCELAPPISESQIFESAEGDDFPLDPRPAGLLRCFALARDGHEHARLRKLRAMAADGKDHENELLFNAYEIAARRFWVDKPWPPAKAARFWLGWLYGLVSNTGRSIVRPLAAWALTILLFWGVFFFCTTDREVRRHDGHCHLDYQSTLQPSDIAAAERRMLTGPSGQALALSIRNAIVLDRSDPATSRRMFGCLYGMTGTETSALPVIPPSVTLLSGLQSIISGALLFLVGLGVRNMFRLK